MTEFYLIFDSAKRKLGRAEEHLDTFKREVEEFLKAKPYSLDTKVSHDRSEFVAYASLIRQAPEHLGLLIGDCLHNLHSALDNIAFELAGGPTDEEIARQIMFPIFTDPTKYVANRNRRLEGIAEGAKAIIDGLQPCNRPNYTPSGNPYPLTVLYELSNRDKHRHLHVAGLAVIDCIIEVGRGGRVVSQDVRLGPFDDGTEIARWVVEPKDLVVHSRFTFSVTIKVGQPAMIPSVLVIEDALRSLLRFIREKVMIPLSRPEFFVPKGSHEEPLH
jgi:hypothetical protein